jgi:hypothetical protein
MDPITALFIALVLYPPEEREMSERMAPAQWQGRNYWGPEATRGRHQGTIPPIIATPHMARWHEWGKKVLRNGDIVFRLGDARVGGGYFRFSRWLSEVSNSPFSHTGIVALELEGPVVYDISRTSVNRQPFCVWVLDNVGSIGVRRLKPEYQRAVPKVLAYCRKVFAEKLPFDYELSDDDAKLYCVEMTEKAFRAAGLKLSDPIRLGDMERASDYPFSMLGLRLASEYVLERPLTFDQLVYFPGTEHYGVWSAKQMMTVIPPIFAPAHPDFGQLPPPALAAAKPPSSRPRPVPSVPGGLKPRSDSIPAGP